MPNIEGINIQQSSAERKSYVVVGAILSCSSGSKQSRLKMPFSHGVFVKGKPQMNIMDFVPNVNIMPFGKCSSLQNPTVASATAANNGVLTPMPCTPLTTMPWIDGKADKMVGGHPALLNKSTNMCFYCGQIKIEDDGQDLGGVTIGNQSSTNSGPSAAGFGQGPACENPQEKPSMWDNFVKGISILGDVPAAMQKAASELPGALEKAANDLPRELQKAAEDLPKGVGAFVREGFIEPMQEDLDTLRDDKVDLADGIAIGGLALSALTLGRSKNIKDLVDAARKGKKATGKIDYVEETTRFGGKLYSEKDLKLLGKYLEKRGVTLKVGDEFLPPNKGGAFNANDGELYLRSNPTQYEVWHELSHYIQYRNIGKEAYLKLPRTQGRVPYNDLTQFNAPEQFVFDIAV
ncbi:zincin-like metallopeptidase toxin 4 of polymorphic toxin system [Brevibacillus sp. AG162]|nr:zincin-like metallopeptidase toxin 4 of polymorphic toxin system [Brevibacillus sp. AG162]